MNAVYSTVALRNLEKKTSSDEVSKTAAGALWVLENRDHQESQPESAKPGMYVVYVISKVLK